MLKLVFHLSDKPYAIDVLRVLEVLPLIPLQSIPGVPEYVAGLLQHRGNVIPVIDLTQLITGIASVKRLSTRIIVIDASSASRQKRALGLICERVTDTTIEQAPASLDTHHDIQTSDIETILPQSMYDFLFDLARS